MTHPAARIVPLTAISADALVALAANHNADAGHITWVVVERVYNRATGQACYRWDEFDARDGGVWLVDGPDRSSTLYPTLDSGLDELVKVDTTLPLF